MSERAAGSIYDLGYQRYEGRRLGRVHTFRALYLESLRGAFGFGRRTSSKVFPFVLLAIAAFPAVVQVIIGTFSDGVVELLPAEDYFEFISLVLALFCAAVAPEMVGRDLRNRTLAIYFARSMGRLDYAGAKLSAMVTAMLVVTVGPLAVLFLGNGLATNDLPGYFKDNWDLILPILASSLLASILLGTIWHRHRLSDAPADVRDHRHPYPADAALHVHPDHVQQLRFGGLVGSHLHQPLHPDRWLHEVVLRWDP